MFQLKKKKDSLRKSLNEDYELYCQEISELVDFGKMDNVQNPCISELLYIIVRTL
jgi:hypothetical protein